MPTPHVTITRRVPLPDAMRVARCQASPHLGPHILFFSGGSALKGVSRELIKYTFNSTHLITPFDSGGSSKIIRNTFNMPAVGDIRNRLMALADQSLIGNPAIYELFAYRLPKDKPREDLLDELDSMCSEKENRMIAAIPDPMRKIIRNHLKDFKDRMPQDFDLRGASVGNMILTAGYLTNRCQLDPVIFIFSKLVAVRGVVRPTINKDLHLAVELEDGTVIIGQHRFTGKETGPIKSPIKKIWITGSLDDPSPVVPRIRDKIRKRIQNAELICYPIGSFYSSIMANLLPSGIGKAISMNPGPKVFTPNAGRDPEMKGHSLEMMVDHILEALQTHCPEARTEDLLQYVMVDPENVDYPFKPNRKALQNRGIELIHCSLGEEKFGTKLDPDKLSKVLVSMT